VEDEFNEDGEMAESEDDEAGSLYPLRASLTITKVASSASVFKSMC
jgi:complement component 1 Q subcomponent-binding protein